MRDRAGTGEVPCAGDHPVQGPQYGCRLVRSGFTFDTDSALCCSAIFEALSSFVGTPVYYLGFGLYFASTRWAVGVLIYEMLAGSDVQT